MRYLLFGKDEFYYANGGANDFKKSSNDLNFLIDYANKKSDHEIYINYLCWWHIFDAKLNKIIAGTEAQAYGADDLKVNDNFYVIEEFKKS